MIMADIEARLAALEAWVGELDDLNATRRLQMAYGYYTKVRASRPMMMPYRHPAGAVLTALGLASRPRHDVPASHLGISQIHGELARSTTL
jgi:hypothetical protein